MDKGPETPMESEISMQDIMDEIKDLVEIVDIIHTEISGITVILNKKTDKPSEKKNDKKDSDETFTYMHG